MRSIARLTLALSLVGTLLNDSVSTEGSMTPTLEAPMVKMNVGQYGHSGFPGMTRVYDGSLRLVFREGSDHWAKRDGKIVMAESHDDGVSWENPKVIRVNPDYRDPSISTIDGIEYLTWFGANSNNPGLGAGVMRSWNEGRRIDALAIGAISAPIVKLPNGQLGAAFYGRWPGESIDTAFMAWSSDSGWTWRTNRIVNMIGRGIASPEPYLVVNGGMTHMFYRWGPDGIGVKTSVDSGVTFTVDRRILWGASGRPTTLATKSGKMVMVYRERPSNSAAMAYSLNNGVSWTKAGIVLTAPAGSPLGMTYAAMVESVEPDVIRLIVGMEQPDGSSDLWTGRIVL